MELMASSHGRFRHFHRPWRRKMTVRATFAKPPSGAFLASVRTHDPYGYKPFPVEP
jgi:hypothetical protein